MNNINTFAPRLLAGFGTAALVAGVGLFASSRPAHTAGGPIAVTVANTVPTLDTESPARQPFQQEATLNFSGGSTGQRTLATVPAGKRLVIESLTAADSGFTAGRNSYDILLSSGFLSSSSGLLGLALTPSGDPAPIKTQNGRLTVEAGGNVVLVISSSAAVDSTVVVSVSGYLVDVSSASAS